MGMESKHIYKSWSTNIANFIIWASRNSFIGGVFILVIGNSTCSITLVVVTKLKVGYECSGFHTHLFIQGMYVYPMCKSKYVRKIYKQTLTKYIVCRDSGVTTKQIRFCNLNLILNYNERYVNECDFTCFSYLFNCFILFLPKKILLPLVKKMYME